MIGSRSLIPPYEKSRRKNSDSSSFLVTTATAAAASAFLSIFRLHIKSRHAALLHKDDVKASKFICKSAFHDIVDPFKFCCDISILLLILSKIKRRTASTHARQKHADRRRLHASLGQDLLELVRCFLVYGYSHSCTPFYNSD